MVAPFEQAAFSLDVGQVSEPVQSQFGWHVIKVLEKEADRPLTLSTRQQLQSGVFTDWLKERRDEANINADIDLPELEAEPTPESVFQPPPEAPVPPTATVAPLPGSPTTESGTPEAVETPAATSTP
jgi:hypothetical protein